MSHVQKAFIVAILALTSLPAVAGWLGPYQVASVSASAEDCGSGCGSYYRLRVEVAINPQTSCQLTNDTKTFVYYASSVNQWGSDWMSLLVAAHAQG